MKVYLRECYRRCNYAHLIELNMQYYLPVPLFFVGRYTGMRANTIVAVITNAVTAKQEIAKHVNQAL